jgi:hypothetical protein
VEIGQGGEQEHVVTFPGEKWLTPIATSGFGKISSSPGVGGRPHSAGEVLHYTALRQLIMRMNAANNSFSFFPGARLLPLLLLVVLPSVAQAQFNYTTNNGMITITKYTGSVMEVVIPDTITGLPVTTIGDSAFEEEAVTSVTIPNSVTSIGIEAFLNCTTLTNIAIPESVTNIGIEAFQDCVGLTSIAIPDSVTSIGQYVFESCLGLATVTIGDSVTNIGQSAFDQCYALTSVTVPDSVTSLGMNAFSLCGTMTNATLGNGVTSPTFATGGLLRA